MLGFGLRRRLTERFSGCGSKAPHIAQDVLTEALVAKSLCGNYERSNTPIKMVLQIVPDGLGRGSYPTCLADATLGDWPKYISMICGEAA